MYDPALTISSRRFFTLTPRPPTPPEAITRPLNTSYGLPARLPPVRDTILSFEPDPRPRSASSTFSNPASRHRNEEGHHNQPQQQPQPDPPSPPTEPPNPLPTPTPTPEASATPTPDPDPTPCPDCLREANTYLVELTNYPALQRAKTRAAVLAGGDYDAVLLVYDVGSRASLEAVRPLHAEIPLHHHHHRSGGHHRRRGSGLSRRRSSLWLGAGNLPAGDGGQQQQQQQQGGSSLGGSHHNGYGVSVTTGGVFGGGETVVALVGNKADVDAEYDPPSPHHCHCRARGADPGPGPGGPNCGCATPPEEDEQLLLEEKRGALQEADVEQRGLLHPLYRGSQVLEEGGSGDGAGDENEERKKEGRARRRRDALMLLGLLPGAGPRRDGLVDATAPLLSPVSLGGRGSSRRRFPGVVADIPEERWPGMRNSTGNVAGRRSVMSADHELLLGGQQQRMSTLSRRSVRSVQEGRERVLPRMPARAPKTEAIERWIRTGSPAGEDEPAEDEDGEVTRAHSLDSEATTACKRQVSRLEGEMLSRSLTLNVPFFETSAKTGQNVEEAFEAIVREVLREMGREVGPAEYDKCRRKHGQREEVKRPVAEDQEGVWPKATVPEPRRLTLKRSKIALDMSFEEVSLNAEGENTVRRRESMLDRFRKVFTRKSAVMVADVQG